MTNNIVNFLHRLYNENRLNRLLILALIVVSESCNLAKTKPNSDLVQKENEDKTLIENVSYADLEKSIFSIDTYENQRILETGMGFFVAPDVVVTRLSYFTSANNATIRPFDETKGYQVNSFIAVDRINDLILLKVTGLSRNPVLLSDSILSNNSLSIYLSKPTTNVVPIHKGKVISYSTLLGSKLYKISNQLRSKSAGSPVFNKQLQCIGLAFMQVADYETQTFVTPSVFINELLKKGGDEKPLSELNSVNQAKQQNKKNPIKGLVIETDLGNISIRLYNSTPQYRDNFIKLVRENYFDGLLIHRVIKGFGIQSGAADTRYAQADDVVGWKGPGYTLPAHIVPGLYHRRGVIGSPRKPDRENFRKRSDGSQFYIVTGRIYSDKELDELEKEIDYKYTTEQRNTYKTIGGAPHLDGSYTIFGEVTEGLELADRISEVDVDSDYRPKTDLRVKKIRILE